MFQDDGDDDDDDDHNDDNAMSSVITMIDNDDNDDDFIFSWNVARVKLIQLAVGQRQEIVHVHHATKK